MSMSIQQKLLASFGLVVFGAARRRGGCRAGHAEQSNGSAARLGATDCGRSTRLERSAPIMRRGERERTTPFGTVEASGHASGD